MLLYSIDILMYFNSLSVLFFLPYGMLMQLFSIKYLRRNQKRKLNKTNIKNKTKQKTKQNKNKQTQKQKTKQR